MSDIDFTATAFFDRDGFPADKGSTHFLIAKVTAVLPDKKPSEERAGLNIALAIDASGSMSGGKLDAAKEAALGLVEKLDGRDRLTVVSFSSDAALHVDAVPVDGDNASLIRSEISRLKTLNSTNLCGGWLMAADRAEKAAAAADGMTPRVIILSDGHANVGVTNQDELIKSAGDFRNRGTFTSTLGVGDGYDEHLLRGIAEHGGGRLHDAEFTGELSSVLLGEVDDIYDTAVENTELTLAGPEGVGIEVLGREFGRGPGGRVHVPLGPLSNRVERTTVFKITRGDDAGGGETRFLISAEARAAEGSARIMASAPELTLVARDNVPTVDPETAMTVAKMWHGHIVTTMSRMNRDSARKEAEAYIDGELPRFHDYVRNIGDAAGLLRELEILKSRAGLDWGSRTRKEMLIQSSHSRDSRIRKGFDKLEWIKRMDADS